MSVNKRRREGGEGKASRLTLEIKDTVKQRLRRIKQSDGAMLLGYTMWKRQSLVS